MSETQKILPKAPLIFVLLYTDLSLTSGTDLVLFGVKQMKEIIKDLSSHHLISGKVSAEVQL